MKRKIGILALVIAAISFLAWCIIIVTGSAFKPHGSGFSEVTILVFLAWAVSAPTTIFCLAGDVIRFIGKSFASGYNSANAPTHTPQHAKFCQKCGKQIDKSASFCPHCGEKLN